MASTLSIIIPTWNESRTIRRSVTSAKRIGDEVIVADGGSLDDTRHIAIRAGAQVIVTPRGRGPQLHAGAQAASGDILVFMHADNELPVRARKLILRALKNPQVIGGNFRMSFDSSSRISAIFEWLYDQSNRYLRIYWGDSTVFIRKQVYHQLGGFKALPILEDFEFFRRLERSGRTVNIREITVTTSARRFENRPLRQLLAWGLIQGLYLAGVSPSVLARYYPDKRD